MTLIECFDRSIINNIAACLHLRPEKLIFLGDEVQMQLPAERCRLLLAERGIHIRPQLCHVPAADLQAIIAVLKDIVEQEADCVIDISGGDAHLLLAVGAVLSGLDVQKRQHVSVQKFDLHTGTVQDFDGDGKVLPGAPAALSVRELIRLHGGIVHPLTEQPDKKHTPKDLQQLWLLASADPKDWNRKLAVLGEFESRSDSRTQVFLSLKHIRSGIQNYEEKLEAVRDLLKDFKNKGIIRDRSNDNALSYTYTSPLMRWCTLKAGNILEAKTLLEARSLRKQGKPYFDDCQMGVHIDWDGIFYAPEDRIPETRNEIDLILTRGLTPLFISCKNGNIDDDELYKLHTVATLFGGPYARKMLIATDLDRKSPAADRSFIQRAKDMNICLVPEAATLSDDDWKQIFYDAMQ